MNRSEKLAIAEKNIAIFQKWFDASNAGDHQARQALYHPDISHELPLAVGPFPKMIKGRDNNQAFMSSVPKFAIRPNFHDIEIYAFADDPYELVAEYKSDMELVSGREYKNSYVCRVTIKDDLIHVFRELPDPLRLVVALGGSVNPPTDLPHIVHSSEEAQA
jgi:ketosteroid isomerase-like protein